MSCFLTSDTVTNKRQLCELACQDPGKNNTCMSTADLYRTGRLKNISSDGLSLRPGSPCDNFQGKQKKNTRQNFKKKLSKSTNNSRLVLTTLKKSANCLLFFV